MKYKVTKFFIHFSKCVDCDYWYDNPNCCWFQHFICHRGCTFFNFVHRIDYYYLCIPRRSRSVDLKIGAIDRKFFGRSGDRDRSKSGFEQVIEIEIDRKLLKMWLIDRQKICWSSIKVRSKHCEVKRRIIQLPKYSGSGRHHFQARARCNSISMLIGGYF